MQRKVRNNDWSYWLFSEQLNCEVQGSLCEQFEKCIIRKRKLVAHSIQDAYFSDEPAN